MFYGQCSSVNVCATYSMYMYFKPWVSAKYIHVEFARYTQFTNRPVTKKIDFHFLQVHTMHVIYMFSSCRTSHAIGAIRKIKILFKNFIIFYMQRLSQNEKIWQWWDVHHDGHASVWVLSISPYISDDIIMLMS